MELKHLLGYHLELDSRETKVEVGNSQVVPANGPGRGYLMAVWLQQVKEKLMDLKFSINVC